MKNKPQIPDVMEAIFDAEEMLFTWYQELSEQYTEVMIK